MKSTGYLVSAFLCALITNPISSVAQETLPEMSLRFGHFGPATWGSAQADQMFAKELEKRTEGKVKTRFFWSGSLGGPMELPQLVASGAVDIGSIVPPYFPAQWPLLSVMQSLPLTWNDPAQAMDIERYLMGNNKAIQEEMSKNGVRPLVIHGLPPYRLQCTTAIRTLADLKGKRIRSFGDWPPYILKKLGAVPVNVPLGEVYEGLQRGSLDCGYNPIENAGFLKLNEVAKYWSDINFGALASYTAFVGTATYAKWPAVLQQRANEAATVAVSWEKGNFVPAEEKQIAAAKAGGVEFIHFTEQAQLNAMFPDMLSVWEETMCKTTNCAQVKSVVSDIRKLMAQTR